MVSVVWLVFSFLLDMVSQVYARFMKQNKIAKFTPPTQKYFTNQRFQKNLGIPKARNDVSFTITASYAQGHGPANYLRSGHYPKQAVAVIYETE